MEGVFFSLFALAAVGAIAYAFYIAAKRREGAQNVASALGLDYSNGDPLGLAQLPHRLFDRGDRRRVERTVHGDHDGRQVALCDYVYTDVSRDADGQTHQTDHRLSLVMLTLRGPVPWIEISPEGLGRRFLNAIGVGNDVQFESDEFNRAFEVISEDRDFAFTLIDAAMMEWLLAESTSNMIETHGDLAILATQPVGWEQMPGLLATLMTFEDRFSRLVWEKYGVGR